MNNYRYGIAVLTGRLIVGGFFLWSGIQNLLGLPDQIGYAQSKGVPLAPLAVTVASLLLVIGGCSLLSGYQSQLGVAALVLFLLPVTLTMHNFWALQGL